MGHATRSVRISSSGIALAALALSAALYAGPAQAIVGGNIAAIGEYPWQAQIVYDGQHHCGGTLLSSTCVLTAAHCVDGKVNDEERFTVTLGEHSLSWPDLTEQVRQVAQIFTSLAGTSHWTARTVSSIYSPTPDGFRVYLNKSGITPAIASSLGWRVRWNAIP
jgi:hypothetical protein